MVCSIMGTRGGSNCGFLVVCLRLHYQAPTVCVLSSKPAGGAPTGSACGFRLVGAGPLRLLALLRTLPGVQAPLVQIYLEM